MVLFGLGVILLLGLIGCLCNVVLCMVVEKVIFGGVQKEVDVMVCCEVGCDFGGFVFDWVGCFDVYVQFMVFEFEYLCVDFFVSVYFVGFLLFFVLDVFLLLWWVDFDGLCFVVYVIQGMIVNFDFGQFVYLMIIVFVVVDVLVVVLMGGCLFDVFVGWLFDNVWVVEYLLYD